LINLLNNTPAQEKRANNIKKNTNTRNIAITIKSIMVMPISITSINQVRLQASQMRRRYTFRLRTLMTMRTRRFSKASNTLRTNLVPKWELPNLFQRSIPMPQLSTTSRIVV